MDIWVTSRLFSVTMNAFGVSLCNRADLTWLGMCRAKGEVFRLEMCGPGVRSGERAPVHTATHSPRLFPLPPPGLLGLRGRSQRGFCFQLCGVRWFCLLRGMGILG